MPYTDEIVVEAVAVATDEVHELIGELDATLALAYSAEQQHGLDVAAIFQPQVRFFIARRAGVALGCGGVALYPTFAEVKRMYVRPSARGRGVAQALLARIEREALVQGYAILRLETGDRQLAAMRLYERAGFVPCDAFGDYADMAPHANRDECVHGEAFEEVTARRAKSGASASYVAT